MSEHLVLADRSAARTDKQHALLEHAIKLFVGYLVGQLLARVHVITVTAQCIPEHICIIA